jgi:predicted lipid-binding transport protein (Tim44 family)
MGPIAGLAAGLGLAALMSHLGMGEAFANFLMLALLAVAAVFLIAFLMRRFGRGARQEPALATAGASASSSPAGWSPANEPAAPQPATSEPAAATATQRSAFTPASADVSVTGQPLRPLGGTGEIAPSSVNVEQTDVPQAVAATQTGPKLPEGFDLPAFERVAKMIFIRLQAANDARDLDDLRQFTTPEMFAELKMQLTERGASANHTDVVTLEAELMGIETVGDEHLASVRFNGMVKEDEHATAEAFNEIWVLSKPMSGNGGWLLAGIQQV